jgi:hypothetical protein
VRRRVTVNNGRRRRRVGLRGKVDAEALRASGHRGPTRGDPAKVLRGLGRSGDHRRRGITRAEQDTGSGPRARFRRGQGSGRGWKPRGASWRDDKAAASLGRSWDAPERPAHDGVEVLHGGASGRSYWGFGAAAVRR